jgi:hypothetical protein
MGFSSLIHTRLSSIFNYKLILEIMGKNAFSAYMKIVFLTYIFISISRIVVAPGIDFHLKARILTSGSEYVDMRYHQAEYSRFIKDLGRRESGNNWLCVNRIGCFGEWQFAESTVQYLGFKSITLKKFKKNPDIFPPELQRKVLESLIKVNLVLLKDYDHFIGDTIDGVKITKSGLIAASHLGGAQSVKLFLESNGRIDKQDVFGTSVFDYIRKFHSYDLN